MHLQKGIAENLEKSRRLFNYSKLFCVMKKRTKIAVFIATIALFLLQSPSFAIGDKGKFISVYNGQTKPQYKECVAALASRCLIGDTRGIQ